MHAIGSTAWRYQEKVPHLGIWIIQRIPKWSIHHTVHYMADFEVWLHFMHPIGCFPGIFLIESCQQHSLKATEYSVLKRRFLTVQLWPPAHTAQFHAVSFKKVNYNSHDDFSTRNAEIMLDNRTCTEEHALKSSRTLGPKAVSSLDIGRAC
jgi:hypothetical protein